MLTKRGSNGLICRKLSIPRPGLSICVYLTGVPFKDQS